MPDKKFQAWRKRRSSLLNALSSPYPSFLNASIILLSSPLNGSIRGPQYFKPKKKAKAWIPNKRFWEWRKRNVTPECLYHLLFVTPAIFKPGSTVFKSIWMPDKRFQAWRKRRSSTLKASIILLSVIPELFLRGIHKYLKTKEKAKTWIPTSSSPRQSLSRGPRL